MKFGDLAEGKIYIENASTHAMGVFRDKFSFY